jgi:hypothetical protein
MRAKGEQCSKPGSRVGRDSLHEVPDSLAFGSASGMTGRFVPRHSTVILIRSVAAKPLSPVHLSSMVPLSVATVWNVRYGLAAMAG